MRRLFLLLGTFALVAFALGGMATTSGCGYRFQGSHSPLLEQEGVRRIFVAPLVNNTYKAGVENLVYNALIRAMGAGQRVTLVHRAEDADAILEGIVTVAQYSALSTAEVTTRTPNVPTYPKLQVVTFYHSVLDCAFVLKRRIVPAGKPPQIWQSSFSRSKPFPSAVQLDVPGTTTALINESEFERALGDLAADMMADVHESMLAQF